MKEKTTILIVDDDRGIRELLQDFLQQHEFRVLTANNGGQMEAVLKKHDVDLIILDVMLPGKDGLTLCQELRQKSKLPIIMLTAVSEEIDCILGLEMGADDYISKPFNPRTLLARIKAVLRRVDSHISIDEQDLPVYLFSGWRLDTAKRKLLAPDEVEILLSTGEYNLLHAFVKRPQQVLSRDLLLDITKNREAGPYDRSIDIQISRLRQKLEVNPKKPEIIKTVRGGGYVLSTVVEY
jgi:two-component system, OmpR family, response regulator